uniref:Uncharacterized protein n=1 Tax=Arundo donax TaxID=35708 RepID=A0A0A9HQ78_ARUDO
MFPFSAFQGFGKCHGSSIAHLCIPDLARSLEQVVHLWLPKYQFLVALFAPFISVFLFQESTRCLCPISFSVPTTKIV